MSSAPDMLKTASLDFVEARINHLVPTGEKPAVYIVPLAKVSRIGRPNMKPMS